MMGPWTCSAPRLPPGWMTWWLKAEPPSGCMDISTRRRITTWAAPELSATLGGTRTSWCQGLTLPWWWKSEKEIFLGGALLLPILLADICIWKVNVLRRYGLGQPNT